MQECTSKIMHIHEPFFLGPVWAEFYGYHFSSFHPHSQLSSSPSCSSRPRKPNSESRSPSRRWHYLGEALGTPRDIPDQLMGCRKAPVFSKVLRTIPSKIASRIAWIGTYLMDVVQMLTYSIVELVEGKRWLRERNRCHNDSNQWIYIYIRVSIYVRMNI